MPEEILSLTAQDQSPEATGTLLQEVTDTGVLGTLNMALVIGILEALDLATLAPGTLGALGLKIQDQIAQAMETPGLPTQTGVHLKRLL